MADLPRLHAQATRLILSLREGLERLEAAEVWHQGRVHVVLRGIARGGGKKTAARNRHHDTEQALRETERLTCRLPPLRSPPNPCYTQHGLRPGDPSIIARDLQQKLSELQVWVVLVGVPRSVAW